MLNIPTVYTDEDTWYSEACNLLRLKQNMHSSFEKRLMESHLINILTTEPRNLMTIIHVGR